MPASDSAVEGVDVREAEPGDVAAIRHVAEQSLHASYDEVLGESAIDEAVGEWYDEQTVLDDLDDPALLYLVAEREGDDDGSADEGDEEGTAEIVAFSESTVLADQASGTVLWLHVAPEHRDHGIGGKLLDVTQAALADRGVEHVTAEVLAGNEQGTRFYSDQGFEQTGEHDVDIRGETYVERVYVREGDDRFEPHEVGGETLHVDWSETERGSKGAFAAAYSDESGEELWGWYCTACGSFDNAMDSMERLECNDCGNTKKPVRWDAAYL